MRDFGFGGCFADDMGFGKIIQVLAQLETRRAFPTACPRSIASAGYFSASSGTFTHETSLLQARSKRPEGFIKADLQTKAAWPEENEGQESG